MEWKLSKNENATHCQRDNEIPRTVEHPNHG